MNIDNITDIEVLRKLAKSNRIKMKKDSYATDGSSFMFEKNEWYVFEQDESTITIYSDDSKYEACFSYEEAERYLERL